MTLVRKKNMAYTLKVNCETFYGRFRKKYIEGIDYIRIDSGKHRCEKGGKLVKYMITVETFEKIGMSTASLVGNDFRDYENKETKIKI